MTTESTAPSPELSPSALRRLILVAALGYFVDLYDLVLFNVLRVRSLTDLGVPAAEITDRGLDLLNLQMAGMLIGGLVWGVLGDKRGRLAVLYGSIILYSVANIANATVHDVTSYGLWRFVAGVGLAGELGAGVTIVMESMPARARGWGTTVIASVGVFGAATAAGVSQYLQSWRTAYVVGGILGLSLLALRVKVTESGMFVHTRSAAHVARGSLGILVNSASRIRRLLAVTAVGLPTWYVVGVLITFAPEFGTRLGMVVPPTAGSAVFWMYLGLTFGDLASGALSQLAQARRPVIGGFLAGTAIGVGAYFGLQPLSTTGFYTVCFGLGLSCGYWAVFVTTASEQFGTNLRATVTTSVPNFVRGAVLPITLTFKALKDRPELGITGAALSVGAVVGLLALAGLWSLDETYGRSLDFHEE